MTYQTIVVEKSPEGVATVTLNRPEVLNAFNDAMRAEFSRPLRGRMADRGCGQGEELIMKDMVDAQNTTCPFAFNFDAATFKVGDIVSYRVPEAFADMPFVGQLLEVHADHVILHHYGEPEDQARPMRGTREDRPAVRRADALAD